MTVKLLHHSPLWLASNAIRMSHDNHDKSDTDEQEVDFGSYEAGDKDKALIERIGNKFKHKSVMEQLVYWFDIDGISRACLQELARHRTARLTVKSSRYTLKEVINNPTRITDFLVLTGNNSVDTVSRLSLYNLIDSYNNEGVSNDKLKYCLPEAFKTRLQWQIDGRNLQNFLELRTSKDALWEIRELAYNIFDNLPEEHKYLYVDSVKERE